MKEDSEEKQPPANQRTYEKLTEEQVEAGLKEFKRLREAGILQPKPFVH